MQLHRCSFLGPALAALAPCGPAFAGTWIVDDDGGPGVDFLEIQSAIDAAIPGDVVLVHDGFYDAIDLPLGLAILEASGSVVVDGLSRIAATPAGLPSVLVGLELNRLEVSDCSNTVVLDSLLFDLGSDRSGPLLAILRSVDVRAIGIAQGPGGFFVSAEESRLELVQSSVVGYPGSDSDACYDAGDGGAGIWGAAARIHLAGTGSRGGRGGDHLLPDWDGCGQYGPGDGGPGVRVMDGSELIVAGNVGDVIGGGQGGWDFGGGSGASGLAIRVDCPPAARVSGVSLIGGGTVTSGPIEFPSPADPVLRRVGTPGIGSPVHFAIEGPPGASARLLIGRRAVLEPIPGQPIERLVETDFVLDFGNLPPNGAGWISLNVPLSVSGALTLFAQAQIVHQGATMRTNSVPVVLVAP